MGNTRLTGPNGAKFMFHGQGKILHCKNSCIGILDRSIGKSKLFTTCNFCVSCVLDLDQRLMYCVNKRRHISEHYMPFYQMTCISMVMYQHNEVRS